MHSPSPAFGLNCMMETVALAWLWHDSRAMETVALA